MDSSDGKVSSGCDGCELGRRAFVARTAQSVAVLLGLGLQASLAQAVPVASARRRGDERRYRIPTADGVSIDPDASLILARVGSGVYAFSLACPHKRTALRWQANNNRFECPKHHSRYKADGTFISGRATRGMDRYGIRREGEFVVVDLGRIHRDDQDSAGWRAAVVQLTGST